MSCSSTCVLSPASPGVSSSLCLASLVSVSLSALPRPPQQGYNLGHLSLVTINTRAGFKFKIHSTPEQKQSANQVTRGDVLLSKQ